MHVRGGGMPQIESGGKVSGRSERGGIAADWLSVHNAHLYFCIYIFLLSYPDTQNVYMFLAPTGALVLMMVYYISIRPLFQILSIYAFLYCYKCHSKSLKQYQCN